MAGKIFKGVDFASGPDVTMVSMELKTYENLMNHRYRLIAAIKENGKCVSCGGTGKTDLYGNPAGNDKEIKSCLSCSGTGYREWAADALKIGEVENV